MELSKELKVNYKTACLLQTKARILMKNSNSMKFLDSNFYESDVAYTGAPSHNGKRGLVTDKQPFLIVLSTEQENQYPRFVKMQEVATDSSNIIKGYFEKYVKMSKERKLNTDGKTTYNILKNRMIVNNEAIDYDNDNHRLYFLNKIIANWLIDSMKLSKNITLKLFEIRMEIQSQELQIYHG